MNCHSLNHYQKFMRRFILGSNIGHLFNGQHIQPRRFWKPSILICGKQCKTISQEGACYFITFIDDFSRKVWVYFLKYKLEALFYLQKNLGQLWRTKLEKGSRYLWQMVVGWVCVKDFEFFLQKWHQKVIYLRIYFTTKWSLRDKKGPLLNQQGQCWMIGGFWSLIGQSNCICNVHYQ